MLGKNLERPREALDRLLALLRVEIVVVDAAQVEIARGAYLTFGRASGHPARLNYGDAFAYALARARDVPLAYVGDDFSLTDLRCLRLA
jgi:ribonuclease VapC